LFCCSPALAEPIPCLDSGPECINQLTEAAITHNSEIASLDERLELVGKQINRQYERRWTAILPALGELIDLNPIGLIETLFGGGGFRDVDLKIADLEVRTSDLIRRRAEVTVELHGQVTDLLLGMEKSERQMALLQSQILSHQQRVAVMEAGYRTGQGSTTQMIGVWQQDEDLQSRLTEAQVNREQSVRKLSELTGYDAISTDAQRPADTDNPDDRDGVSGSLSAP
jgi:hypothetical protein